MACVFMWLCVFVSPMPELYRGKRGGVWFLRLKQRKGFVFSASERLLPKPPDCRELSRDQDMRRYMAVLYDDTVYIVWRWQCLDCPAGRKFANTYKHGGKWTWQRTGLLRTGASQDYVRSLHLRGVAWKWFGSENSDTDQKTELCKQTQAQLSSSICHCLCNNHVLWQIRQKGILVISYSPGSKVYNFSEFHHLCQVTVTAGSWSCGRSGHLIVLTAG